jgi:hypothetical protein
MKNKLFVAIFFILITGFLNAQNLDLKGYYDATNGYMGMAVAIYLDNSELENIESKFSSIGRDINKLTRENYWLCWEALGEWDIEDGETYLILCADNRFSENLIIIIAKIENGGKSFSWWGKNIFSSDLE